MTIAAFLLILLSVFLHTGWNFLTKAHHPSVAFLLLVNTAAAAVLLPFVFLIRIPWCSLSWEFWIFLAGSVIAQIVYAYGMSKSYQKNDMSLAYPMIRALPVILVTALTLVFHIGKTPSPLAVTGMVIVAAGCLILPQKDFHSFNRRNYVGPALIPILISAVGTTGYTILDSQALKLLREQNLTNQLLNAGIYSFIMELLVSLGLGIYVLCSAEERKEFRIHCIGSLYPYLCGIFSCAAYLLVLIAMGYVTNVSFLQAFRQMSLPLGVAAGLVILHEKNSTTKMAGVSLIVAGLILTVI